MKYNLKSNIFNNNNIEFLYTNFKICTKNMVLYIFDLFSILGNKMEI